MLFFNHCVTGQPMKSREMTALHKHCAWMHRRILEAGCLLGFVKTTNHRPIATKLFLHGVGIHAQGMSYPTSEAPLFESKRQTEVCKS